MSNEYTERVIQHLNESIRNIRKDALQDAVTIVEEQFRAMELANKTERVNALRVVLYRLIALRDGNTLERDNHLTIAAGK